MTDALARRLDALERRVASLEGQQIAYPLRLCPGCNQMRPYDADAWRNDAGRGTRYVCAACSGRAP